MTVPAANTKQGELKINTGEQTCAGSSNQRTWIHQLIMMAGYTESCLSSTAWELAARDASGKRAPFPVSSALPFKMRGSLLSSVLSQLLEVSLCGAESAQAALAMRDIDGVGILSISPPQLTPGWGCQEGSQGKGKGRILRTSLQGSFLLGEDLKKTAHICRK